MYPGTDKATQETLRSLLNSQIKISKNLHDLSENHPAIEGRLKGLENDLPGVLSAVTKKQQKNHFSRGFYTGDGKSYIK